jgi:uncharacterized protein YoxC
MVSTTLIILAMALVLFVMFKNGAAKNYDDTIEIAKRTVEARLKTDADKQKNDDEPA